MLDSFFTLNWTQSISIILVLVLLFLWYKLISMRWSYKISKPYRWEESVKKGSVSANLKSLERSYRDKVRFYTFWLQAQRISDENILGAFAELGVYRGNTANILHELNPQRQLHLFDTFSGFAEADLKVELTQDAKYNKQMFEETSVEAVKAYINGNNNIHFHAGYFPETTADLPEQPYAFVHLGADLYQPTLSGLQYFYPRMSAGGVIIVHDYNHNWPGVKKAVDEFSITIPERLTFMADWQGSVMIVRDKH